ncbi:hypothetical protein EGW08_000637 [Elysia chlorotica]|uniref:Uncharacterized protein n=1 Tax=Elysia chlorotica TaxID=188477 RepID=A0A3S1A682_ELYCH|nr:hypothetical protein EGW08_000637 [Elysia chlorotica]
MNQHEDIKNKKLPSQIFVVSPGGIPPCQKTDSMDVENSQELGESKQNSKDLGTGILRQIRSSSTISVCPSPQLAPSPQSGPRSVPPYFPHYASLSPSHPASPATASPACNPVLGSCSPFQLSRNPSRQLHSDGETSQRPRISKHGHRMLLQRSHSSTTATTSRANARASAQPFSIQRRIGTQAGSLQSNDGLRNSLIYFPTQTLGGNQNVVSETLNFLDGQNQADQSHFLAHSPSSILSQDSMTAQGSPSMASTHLNMSQSGVASPTSVHSDFSGSSKQQRHVFSGSLGIHPSNVIGHSSDPNLTQGGSQSVEQDTDSLNCQNRSPLASILRRKSETGTAQESPVSFAQSYTSLTPWTTRLATERQNALLNENEEVLPLSLGVVDNLPILSPSAKENRLKTQQNYSLFNQPYSCLQDAETDSDGSSNQAKDSYKVLPNKQLRFRKTADALQKSGLWEVAMKTGNLIRRNKELQKELDKFRADALVFLKSVIKNPHNWRLIKNILSNALSANQSGLGKASPIMTVVVSAAQSAAAASARLDSAGSSTGSSSLCGNISDSSGSSNSSSSSNALRTSFVGDPFAANKHEYSCVAMDVN